MRILRKSRSSRDAGAVAVETALILPILLLLLFGIVEFGLLFNRSQGLHAAAREAARLGSLEGVDAGTIEQRAEDAAPPFVDLDDLDVHVYRGEAGEPGDALGASQIPCDRSEVDPGDEEYVTVQVILSPPETDPNKYAVTIPMWGSFTADRPFTGVFACEL